MTKEIEIPRIVFNPKYELDKLYLGLHKNKIIYGPENGTPKTDVRKVTPIGLPNGFILDPLNEVFLEDSLKDAIVSRAGIPALLTEEEPTHSGVILFGPAGTGKTVLLRAIAEVYQRAGAYAEDVSVAELNTCLVGEFARRLEEKISDALEQSEKRKKPSFLAFDEATLLTQEAGVGSGGVSKHYQEALDVLKRVIGNKRGLVFGISTNEDPENFDKPLTREGRLTAFRIDYPNTEQKARMWRHFARRYELLNLTDPQADRLAELIPGEHGAFIEELCRSYHTLVQNRLMMGKGGKNLVDALARGITVSPAEVSEAITFNALLRDVETQLRTKSETKEPDARIGF